MTGVAAQAVAPSGWPPGGGTVLAHGVGSRSDLPLPFEYAVAGAGTAVVVSFLALALLWRAPRLDGRRAGRPLPPPVAPALESRVLRRGAAGAGLVVAGWTLVALFLGPDNALNPVPWVVYVLLWVGVVPLSLLFGPATWKRLNPIRTVHHLLCRAVRLDPGEGKWPLPERLGWWPAALGLLAFVWLELAAPDGTTQPVLQVAVSLYAAVQLAAALMFGSGWFDRGDAFEAWSSLFGRMSVLGRRPADGSLVLRSPLAGLDALRAAPGLVATVSVMLGSTAFDSLREHPAWFTMVQTAALPVTLANTLGLLAVVAALGALFVLCTRAAGWAAGTGGRAMPAAFAHSVVPIALGYVVAHYTTLLVLEGQTALIRLSDPLGTGADWLGTGDRQVDTTLVTPTGTAVLQVTAIVTGHVVGVVLAHDRAVRLFPRGRAVLGQLPLLALMVSYTCLGLLLLFEP